MRILRNKHGSLPEQLRHYISDIVNEARQISMLYTHAAQNSIIPLLSVENEMPGSQQMVQCYLEQLMIQLYRMEDVHKEPPLDLLLPQIESQNQTIQGMQSFIQQNVYHRIAVKDVCKHIGYSNAYLTTLMKKHCNITIAEYINRVKIAEACSLIRRGASNFSEISNMLCYSDPHYFSRVFRKTTGMSPTEYRNSVLP